MEGPPSGATLYLVPAVARSGRALAVLEVHPRPGLALEPATGDRLRALAKVVGATLELLLELGAARQRDDAWSAIVPAVRGLARATSTASVFATLGPVVRQQFNGGTLWLLVPQPACEDWTLWTEHAYAVAQANPSAAVPGVPRLAVTELEASLTGEIWIGNTEASELALAQLASGSGIGAMLGQRYTDGRSTLGFVLIGWRRAGEGAPEHAARLALLTDDIAAALLRIRESETQAADALRSDRLRLVGAMANGVAHGLNNAIGGIIGHADLAAMRDDLDQTRQDLAWIRGAAEQARHTLQRLRLAGAVMHPRELDVLDLNLVAIAAVSEFQAAWRRQPGVGAGSRLAVETDLRAARHVYGDGDHLRDIVLSLLTNGAEAGGRDLRLTVRTWSDEGQVYLQVRDNGPGIPPQIAARLFEPFVSTKSGAGRGLGLAIAWGVVNAHGGHINVQSAPGAGAAFTLQLPASGQRAARAEADAPTTETVPYRILLVEDEASVRTATKALLERDHHEVVVANDASSALANFQPEHFDLCITDLGLPDRSGTELLTSIHAQDPALPAIVVTGYADSLAPPERASLNIKVVLLKPYGADELRAAIERAMRAPAGAANGQRPE